MAFTLNVDQKVSATISFVDSHGNPAKVDGVPVWTSSNDAVVAVVAADDGMSAVMTSGTIGTATIDVHADADMGEGVRDVTTSSDMEVTGGEAGAVEVVFGAPEPK